MDNHDTIVVQGLKNSDFNSFDLLYKKYVKRLYCFALGYLKSHGDAEEMVQEVFLKVWEKRHTLDETRSFNSYLFTITKNSILNHFRKKANEESYVGYLKQNVKSMHTGTEENIIYSDLEMHLKNIINKLPDKRKEIFILSRELGYSNEKIAEVLNISKKTVENQITNALKYIQEHLTKTDF